MSDFGFQSTKGAGVCPSLCAVEILGTGCCSVVRCSVSNTASGAYSAALAGCSNTSSGCFSTTINGFCNNAANDFSFIPNGCYNQISSYSGCTLSGYVCEITPTTYSIYGDFTSFNGSCVLLVDSTNKTVLENEILSVNFNAISGESEICFSNSLLDQSKYSFYCKNGFSCTSGTSSSSTNGVVNILSGSWVNSVNGFFNQIDNSSYYINAINSSEIKTENGLGASQNINFINSCSSFASCSSFVNFNNDRNSKVVEISCNVNLTNSNSYCVETSCFVNLINSQEGCIKSSNYVNTIGSGFSCMCFSSFINSNNSILSEISCSCFINAISSRCSTICNSSYTNIFSASATNFNCTQNFTAGPVIYSCFRNVFNSFVGSGVYTCIDNESNVVNYGSVIAGGVGHNSLGGVFDCDLCAYTTAPNSKCNMGSLTTIGGGLCNNTQGFTSTIVGGEQNKTIGLWSTIGGGECNVAQGIASFIGGGSTNYIVNTVSPCCALGSVIAGGVGNNTCGGTWNFSTNTWDVSPTCVSTRLMSFIGGGFQNVITTPCSVIAGGFCNCTFGVGVSTIVGGFCNCTANGTIVGGECNCTGTSGIVVAGFRNCSGSPFSSIVSGENNQVSACGSTIITGKLNTITAACSFIGAGENNNITGVYSSIVGGCTNLISGQVSTIGGGLCNVIGGSIYSFIGAGSRNTICGSLIQSQVIGGGDSNFMCSALSFIGGGFCNNISNTFGGGCVSIAAVIGGGIGNGTTGGTWDSESLSWSVQPTKGCVAAYTFTGGGVQNTASGCYSVIGGGLCNCITSAGVFSGIIGGSNNTVQHMRSFIVGSNITTSIECALHVNNLVINNLPNSPAGLPSKHLWYDNGTCEVFITP